MKINGFNLNNPVEQTLKATFAAGRFPHAIILEGGTVQERMELGRNIAAALTCSESKAQAPCGECSHCKKNTADSHPDVLIYSVEDKPRAFKVDLVRDIRNKAFIIPNEADRKVFILENSHTMGIEGQNAILKILEEPPSYVNFILLCSSKSGFLPTVLSRATVYSVGEAETFDSETDFEKTVEAASAVAKSLTCIDDFETVKAASVFEKDAKLLKAALPVMQEIFAAALRTKHNAAENSNEFGNLPTELASRLSGRALLDLCETVNSLMASLRMNANHNLMVTALCTSLRKAVSK